MPAIDSVLLKQTFLDEMHGWFWQGFINGYVDSLTGRSTDTRAGIPDPNIDPSMTGEEMSLALHKGAQLAENYYVTPEMQVLVTAAAETMPDDEQPTPEDFPSAAGWLLVPGGITQIDIRGRPCTTSVILWNVYGGEARLVYLADKTHPLDQFLMSYEGPDVDEERRRLFQNMPRLSPWAHSSMEFGRPLPQSIGMGLVIPPEVSREFQGWRDEKTGSITMAWPKGFSAEEMTASLEVRVDPVGRWLLACLRIMQQPLARVTDQGLPTQVRKRMGKAVVKMKRTKVTVIEFRRFENVLHDGSGREFSHRFLRRGHWRRQPYKNDDGEWDRRRIWIHPTIVGDPSKPLILRDHVNALVR